MSQNTELNKRHAVEFYDMLFNKNQPEKAMSDYAGNDYIQHNPMMGSGKQAVIDYFTRMAKEYPNKQIHFKRVIAENDYVILHCLQEWPTDKNYAGVDIFRFDEQGKIVEHWDVLQIIPEQSKNANTMF